MLLPRFKRKLNPKLEEFIIKSINKELSEIGDEDYFDLIEMQYFFEFYYENLLRNKKRLILE